MRWGEIYPAEPEVAAVLVFIPVPSAIRSSSMNHILSPTHTLDLAFHLFSQPKSLWILKHHHGEIGVIKTLRTQDIEHFQSKTSRATILMQTFAFRSSHLMILWSSSKLDDYSEYFVLAEGCCGDFPLLQRRTAISRVKSTSITQQSLFDLNMHLI